LVVCVVLVLVLVVKLVNDTAKDDDDDDSNRYFSVRCKAAMSLDGDRGDENDDAAAAVVAAALVFVWEGGRPRDLTMTTGAGGGMVVLVPQNQKVGSRFWSEHESKQAPKEPGWLSRVLAFEG